MDAERRRQEWRSLARHWIASARGWQRLALSQAAQRCLSPDPTWWDARIVRSMMSALAAARRARSDRAWGAQA